MDFTKLSSEQIIQHFGGTSNSIRKLKELNFSTGEIAKILNKKYQHVRNVLITPVKNPKLNGQTKNKVNVQDLLKKLNEKVK